MFVLHLEHDEQAGLSMAAKPHALRDAAIATIRNLTAFHGAEEGEKLARAKYSAIPKGTFSGWVKLARLPAEPPSAPAGSVRASASIEDAGDLMPFEQRIALLDRHIQMIVAASTREVIEEPSGERKTVAKNPSMLAQAVRLQHAAAELLAKNQRAVWTVEAVAEYHGEVIDAITAAVKGAADRELAERVVAALNAIKNRWTAPSRDDIRASLREVAA